MAIEAGKHWGPYEILSLLGAGVNQSRDRKGAGT